MTISRKASRIAPYLVVLGIAGFLYHSADRIDYFAPAGRIGPDFWPKMVLILMIATCIYQIVKIGLAAKDGETGGIRHRISAPGTGEGDDAAPDEGRSYPLLLILGIAATVLYVAAVPITGFFLATFPYLVVFMYLGRYRRLPVAVSVSLIGTLLMLYFFMKVVYVSLPIGRAPFSAVSLFLMQVMGVR